MDEQDKLYKSAQFYKEHLENKRYVLIACHRQKMVALHVFFDETRFAHMAGLGKISDLGLTKNSKILYHQILTRELTEEFIKKSEHYSSMVGRLENFHKIEDILKKPDDMRKSLYGVFGKSIQADYLLSQEEEGKYYHLFLKDEQDVVIPVTFFDREDSFYINRQAVKWTIVDIEQLNEKDEIKTQVYFAKLRAHLLLQTGKTLDELKQSVQDFKSDNTKRKDENGR